MFSRSIRIYRCLQLYSLFILLIHENQTFVLSDVDEPLDRDVTDITWAKVSINSINDKHNVRLLKDTRSNILKLSLLIISGIFILFLIGAIVSVIVFCVKKK